MRGEGGEELEFSFFIAFSREIPGNDSLRLEPKELKFGYIGLVIYLCPWCDL